LTLNTVSRIVAEKSIRKRTRIPHKIKTATFFMVFDKLIEAEPLLTLPVA
jgi:hypothetical protein